jgi:hypothetical protein
VIDTSALPAADLMRRLTGRFVVDGVSLRIFVTNLARRHGTQGLPI